MTIEIKRPDLMEVSCWVCSLSYLAGILSMCIFNHYCVPAIPDYSNAASPGIPILGSLTACIIWFVTFVSYLIDKVSIRKEPRP